MILGRFQKANHTQYHRYPEGWQRLCKLIRRPMPRVLSFGCSTGEECFTALSFFPDAIIIGCEADPVMLRMARLRHSHPQISYVMPDQLEGMPPVDAILCNSVLCNHPENSKAQVNERMTFEAFDLALQTLDKMLLNGGVLMLYNPEYRIEDSSIAGNYVADKLTVPVIVAMFDVNCQRIEAEKYHPVWRKSTE
jgi:trans-aconitate methyltransferase